MGISIFYEEGFMVAQAPKGGSRFSNSLGSLRKALRASPRWESNRVLASGAAAAIAVLTVTGVVALSTTGSASPRAKDAAATAPPSKPHYLLPIAALVAQGDVPPPTLDGDNGTVGVPAGTAPVPTAPSAPDPGSSDIGVFRGAPGTLTPVDIATLALQRGCNSSQAPTATAVAMAESGGSPSAQGDITLMTAVWDWSAGLWQIRGLRSERGTGGLRDSIANQVAATNSAAMFTISSGCTNWTPWTTYTRGIYVGYLSIATQAVNYVVSYYRSHGRYPIVAAPDPTAVIPVASGAEAAAPAPAPSSSAPKKAKPTKATSTPKAPASTTSSSGGERRSTGGDDGATPPTSPAAPKPTKSTTAPRVPVPSITVPAPTTLPVVPLPAPPALPVVPVAPLLH